jgi:predicted nuclease of restriction endonuclease-like (RecB) superfamily
MSQILPWASFGRLVDELATLHGRARAAAARSVDEILTLRSWLIGVWIVAFEQNGADRAAYGEGLLEALALEFKRRGVVGLGASNLKNFRQLALTWPRLGIRQTASGETVAGLPERIRQTVSGELIPELTPRSEPLPWQDDAWQARLRQGLSFSHLLELSRVSEPLARAFYEVQALAQGWSVRELKRQRESMLFERIGLSRDRDAVLALADQGRLLDTPKAIIRDPYVLEFLGLSERATYLEADLEAALLDHLQAFLLELGGDFAFLGRQYRITVGGRHHFIDLLFFHRRLRCLIAVDLKIGSFGHEDAGQMNFYLGYLRDKVALDDESDPIGIILCADKDAEEVHYATGTLDNQVFVSRYLTRLPTPEQLRRWLADEKELLARKESPE